MTLDTSQGVFRSAFSLLVVVLTCTVVVLTCVVICGCFGNMCTCIYSALYSLNCVFVLFLLCIFILICFVCTSVRTTATE